MSNGLTKDECKKILFKVGIKMGVSPRLISERLLDAEDKCEMLNGETPIELLEVAVNVWKDAGMPAYADGQTEMEVKKGCRRQNHLSKQDWKQEPLRRPFVRLEGY